MADLSTLARPYAKAAFDYAAEHNVAEEWEDFLFIASTVVNDKDFSSMLENPAISADKKAMTLVDIFDSQIAVEGDTPFKALLKSSHPHDKVVSSYPKVSAQLRNFVSQLAEQERLALLPDIYAHYRRHKSRVQKQVDAYITSAYPLTDTQRALLQTRLAASLNAKVVLHEAVDSSLIAGATIKIGDKVVDDSVKGKLKQLKTQLTA